VCLIHSTTPTGVASELDDDAAPRVVIAVKEALRRPKQFPSRRQPAPAPVVAAEVAKGDANIIELEAREKRLEAEILELKANEKRLEANEKTVSNDIDSLIQRKMLGGDDTRLEESIKRAEKHVDFLRSQIIPNRTDITAIRAQIVANRTDITAIRNATGSTGAGSTTQTVTSPVSGSSPRGSPHSSQRSSAAPDPLCPYVIGQKKNVVILWEAQICKVSLVPNEGVRRELWSPGIEDLACEDPNHASLQDALARKGAILQIKLRVSVTCRTPDTCLKAIHPGIHPIEITSKWYLLQGYLFAVTTKADKLTSLWRDASVLVKVFENVRLIVSLPNTPTGGYVVKGASKVVAGSNAVGIVFEEDSNPPMNFTCQELRVPEAAATGRSKSETSDKSPSVTASTESVASPVMGTATQGSPRAGLNPNAISHLSDRDTRSSHENDAAMDLWIDSSETDEKDTCAIGSIIAALCEAKAKQAAEDNEALCEAKQAAKDLNYCPKFRELCKSLGLPSNVGGHTSRTLAQLKDLVDREFDKKLDVASSQNLRIEGLSH
jgi:hypothetical protein